MDSLIAKLYQSPKAVLSTKDLAIIWQEKNSKKLANKTSYYVKQGSLLRLTRGLFAKNKNYDAKELATSIYTPSYISFETILRKSGVIFQHYDTIFAASKWTRSVTIDTHPIAFRKIKDSALFNPSGIIIHKGYCVATQERAFLDMLYLFPKYHFDNLRSIDWEKCAEIAPIYNNKQLLKRLNQYQKNYAQ